MDMLERIKLYRHFSKKQTEKVASLEKDILGTLAENNSSTLEELNKKFDQVYKREAIRLAVENLAKNGRIFFDSNKKIKLTPNG